MTFEKRHQIADHLPVAILGNGADARCGAQLDVEVQAGAFVLPGDFAVAGQVGEHAPQHIQRLVDRPGGGIRPKISRAVFDHLAGDGDFGIRLTPMDFDVGIALVVLQADVVFRPVALDQVHFQDQGFQLRTDHDPLDVDDLAHQPAGLVVVA